MRGLTQDLATFVSRLDFGDIPPQACDTIKIGFIDCLGVLVPGQAEDAPKIVQQTLASADAAEKASLIPSRIKLNADLAALVNGVAAHVLDYDDVTLDGHPSAVLVPAILAQAEACGANGRDMMVAYAAGYETWCELLIREPIPLYAKGWHPTATRGTVAAAAACARLMKLDPAQTATALAIASSMSSGLVANFGSMTKCYQVGRAAQSGLIAARLASGGLTGSLDALEHDSGFLRAFSPTADHTFEKELNRSKTWHLVRQGLNIKRYPVCYGSHRVIDAVVKLLADHPLQAKDIARITVCTARSQMLMMRNERPQTALEAKFSMPFAVTAAVLRKNVGLQDLTDAFVSQPEVQAFFPKIHYRLTDETLNDSAFAAQDWVEIETIDGKKLISEKIVHAKGSHQNPVNPRELETKFRDCTANHLSQESQNALLAKLAKLEDLASVADLLQDIVMKNPAPQ